MPEGPNDPQHPTARVRASAGRSSVGSRPAAWGRAPRRRGQPGHTPSGSGSKDVWRVTRISYTICDMTETVSKSQRAYDAIRDHILDGTYTPGYRLVLGTLADELECSVVPVREAIRRLEAEGLVHFERNVGATVSAVDATLYMNTMQTLAVLEGTATALAAPLISEESLAKAHEINNKMRALLDHLEPSVFTGLNNEFHAQLYQSCPNTHLLDLVHRGWARMNAIRISTFNTIPNRAAQSVAEHDALLAAIEAGSSAPELESKARAHRMTTLNAYLSAVGAPPSTL